MTAVIKTTLDKATDSYQATCSCQEAPLGPSDRTMRVTDLQIQEHRATKHSG